MRLFRLLVLYAGLALMGNPAAADVGKLIGLAEGELGGMRFHLEPKALDAAAFVDANGKTVNLSDYKGKHLVLNFWALWCAPCVKEMPSLNRLDAALEGTGVDVVTVATGRNARPAVDKFFAEKGLVNLPKLFDPKMALARSVGAFGLPTTLLIDPQGREIGRFSGDLEWDSPAAQNLLKTWAASS